MPEGLQLRKLAHKDGDRVAVTHPITGERSLYTPEDAAELLSRLGEVFEGIQPSPYALAGIQITNPDGAPTDPLVTPRIIEQGRAEGWITTSPAEVEPIFRTAGPKESPWAGAPHVFLHYDQVIFHTVDGDYVYDVVENPDKWPEEKDGGAGFGGEVKHVYALHLSGLHEPEAHVAEVSEV